MRPTDGTGPSKRCPLWLAAGCVTMVAAMGCGPGRSVSREAGRVPEASLSHAVVLGSIEMCGEARPVLDRLEGAEHPTWETVSATAGGHVLQWHVFTPRHIDDRRRLAAFDRAREVCGRAVPDVLTFEVVDGMVAEVNAAWTVPAAAPTDDLSCKQDLEDALVAAKGEPVTHRDEWAEREMVLWVWSEPGLKTEVLIDTYDGEKDWELLHDIPRRGPDVDTTFRPEDMAVGDLRVLMRFRCTPLVQQLARDILHEQSRQN